MFKDSKPFNLSQIEEKVLKFWEENDVFNKSLAQRRGKKHFVFFEGPPTANGRPGIHHVLARSFKDVIPRYKTMKGYYAPRRAGWDTHGLPVEIEIEKELGIKSKQEIEKFGIAPFNERAKASVWKYKDEFERLTARLGMWLDVKNPYITYDNNYIESLWWIFSQFQKNKLLKKSYKIIPFCPRCQTGLSSHELGQPGAYRKTKDPSVYVKFEIRNSKFEKSGKFSTSSNSKANKLEPKSYLLVWTTTPWTLPANMAVAVDPKLTYTKYKIVHGNPSTGSGIKMEDEFIWSYSAPQVLEGVEVEVAEKVSGKKLVGLEYEPLYSIQQENKKTKKQENKKARKQESKKTRKQFYKVLAADFIDTAQGTGMVHIAPAYGEDDFRLMKESAKLEPEEIIFSIDESGHVLPGLPGAGKFIKEADKDIIIDLKKRGLVYSTGATEHDYPFCWRCSTPLIYFARSSWFILMSGLRDKLVAANSRINWVPEHVKTGRFGEWIKEVKDWAISRERYWGTPLPIWECEKCDNMKVVGSFKELDDLDFNKNAFFAMRHGESTHNVNDTIAAGKETAKNRSNLTAKGKSDILATAKKLKKEHIDLIFVSPYYRTQETAKLVAKTIGFNAGQIITDKRIIEIDCGVFNGRKIQEHKDYFGGNPVLEFYKAPPGGESLGDVKRRMIEFIKDINAQYSNKNILILSHGDPMWVLEGALMGVANDQLMTVDYIQPAQYKKLDFHNYPYNNAGDLDVHKPYIDEVYLRCNKCKSKMKRVKEVADVWFDAGSMPFAQWHYPFENKNLVDKGDEYPADYIAEGMDQTRGWFYTLLAVAIALGRGTPYLNVISLGLVLDKNGVKMSKSKGNVVDPWAMFSKYGADVVRWHFYTMNDPGEPKRFDENDLLKVYRRFFAIIYNSYVFLETYGDMKGLDLEHMHSKSVLDRWITSRMKTLAADVTDKLDHYKIGEAGRAIESFVDDLSRWYIRRSRRRFQKPDDKKDLKDASATLYWVLLELSKLIAPFVPFFAEGMYQSLKNLALVKLPLSAHLTDWPDFNKSELDNDILAQMAEVRRLSSLALAARAAAGVKVRQPLAMLKLKSLKFKDGAEEMFDILKDEVNVKAVVIDLAIEGELWLDTKITPELKEEGMVREFARLVQDLRQSADYKPGELAMFFAELPENLRAIIEKNQKALKAETSLKSIEFKKVSKFDAESITEVDGAPVWVAIRK